MPLNQRGQVGSLDSLNSIQDLGNTDAHPASDERLESVRALLDTIEDNTGNFADGYDKHFEPNYEIDAGEIIPLPAGSVPDGVEVLVQAHPDNYDNILIGVTNNPQIVLEPGNAFSADVADRSQIHVKVLHRVEDYNYSTDAVNISHEVSE